MTPLSPKTWWRRRVQTQHMPRLRPVRVGRRLVALCLAFALPTGVLLSVAWNTQADHIALTRAEREGLALLQPVREVLALELELVAAYATRVETPAHDEYVRQLRDRVDERLLAVTAAAGAVTAFDGSSIDRNLDSVDAAWSEASETGRARKLAGTTAAIRETLNLVDAVVNASTLAQDPEFTTYYLITASLVSSPDILEGTSNLGTSGRDALHTGEFSAETRTNLISLTALLETESRRLVADLGYATGTQGEPQLASAFEQPLVRTIAAVTKLLDHGERLGRDAVIKPTEEELSTQVAETSASVFALWDVVTDALDRLLDERLQRLRRSQREAAVMVITAVAVVIALMLSTTSELRRRREAEEALLHQAAHDALTGLPNRTLFRERLEQAAARTRRTREPMAVLFIDVDDFKHVNDRLGHAVGDELLLAIAERIRTTVRTTDTAARLGGDEFAVLLEDVSDIDAVRYVAHALLESLRQPVPVSGAQLPIHVSIGVAISYGDSDPDVLLRNADVAMYRAKNQGKGSVEIFDGVVDGNSEDIELMAGLHNAAARNELTLHYQPKVALETGEIVGAEALVRWEHPQHGLVPPLRFIPYAERSGLIIEIGRWVLRHACEQAASWHRRWPQRRLLISVNVSPRQLRDATIVDDVRDALREADLPPDLLVLELTESAIADGPRVLERLNELKALGVRLAIDDFGTGYSSLAYLTRLPIDIVKIDKTFVDHIETDATATLTRKIIELSQTLGFQTIAEGVETAGQVAALRRFGCRIGQGYLFSKPASAASLESMFDDENAPMGSLVLAASCP